MPSSGRVDYAFLKGRDPIVLVEAKSPRESLDNHADQLLKYAFDKGVELALLTNGIECWFYLPLEKGDWETRKFYSIDLLNQEEGSVCDRFIEFLSKDNVISGAALKNAKNMRNKEKRSKRIQQTLPEVWTAITTEPNEILIDLLIEETERKCGFKPDESEVKNFLQKIVNDVSLITHPKPYLSKPTANTRLQPSGINTKRPLGRKGYHLLPDYVIPVINLIKSGVSHTDAFRQIAEKLNVRTPTVSSQCTRSLHISTEKFVELVKSDEIKSFLKEKFHDEASLIEQEL